MIRPSDVLELRERILMQWRGPYGGLLESPDPRVAELGRMAGAAISTLFAAECFYWADWTCDAVAAAGAQLPTTWRLERSLLPVPKAFWYFERPLPLPEYGAGEGLRAIAWTPVVEIDEQWIAVAEAQGLKVGDENYILVSFFMDSPQGGLPFPATAYQYPFGVSIADMHHIYTAQDKNPNEGKTARSLAKLKYFGAALSFLDQRIVQGHRQAVDRHTAHRLRRLRPQDTIPDIHVIRLRRAEPLDRARTDAVGVWQCQWIVRGHWRMAWYPTRAAHQPVWVRPHVKGPADKPLKLAEQRLFAVVR
jgi:hypothetical protein